MSEFDPVASIQRFYDAENEFIQAPPESRDISVMLKELDPEVVVHVPDSLPHGGIWRGHQGFVDLFDVVTAEWQEFSVSYDVVKWHQIDDRRFLTQVRLNAVLRSSGLRVDMAGVSIFTFTSRGLSYLDHYYKDTAAIVCPSAPA